jgi:malto-oligosyltrehalose trehalohydrolase
MTPSETELLDTAVDGGAAHRQSDRIVKDLQGALPPHLMTQRWYGAKNAGLPVVRKAQCTAFGDDTWLLVLDVTPGAQARESYFLPIKLMRDLVHTPNGPTVFKIADVPVLGSVIDAFADDGFLQRLLAPFGDERGAQLRTAGLIYRRFVPAEVIRGALADAFPAHRSAAEQSNTSVRLGGVMFKAFRKLVEGVHPEFEMNQFLSNVACFPHVPPLLGTIELPGENGDQDRALSILQEHVSNKGDGWSYVCALMAEIVSLPHRAAEDSAEQELGRLARRLGQRTAELHQALASTTDDPAFKPEPMERGYYDSWVSSLCQNTTSALAMLQEALPTLDVATRSEATRLVSRARELSERIDDLSDSGVDVKRTRLHGDFHLGQILVTDDDVYIIDFEGEPMRPLSERRAKHLPLRDVAGMVRSFDYAAANASRAEALDASKNSTLRHCAEAMSAVFLDSYLHTIQGCPSFPADTRLADRLLRLFVIEKAVYEIGYELANRPEWVGIPIASLLAELDREHITGFDSGQAHQRDPDAEPPSRLHRMPFGCEPKSDGTSRFRLWAPAQERVSLIVEGRDGAMPMQALPDGWHELTARVAAGEQYRFQLTDGTSVPDPASRYQPLDVHGPSEVIDPGAYAWQDADWKGRPWHEAIFYELHVGTFTPEGTFRSVIEHLDHLANLGITAIELMPLGDFPGKRNWGYDGVFLFTPESSYGRPEDLKALIDAAHAKGIMVFLDVVYNHFGPEGNYIPAVAPQIFTDRHKTPWGAAINYDGPESGAIRDLMIHNALYWLEEFHFDGLRLDAVHAIIDDSPRHVLDELADRIRETFADRRQIHLVLENEENEAHRLANAPLGHASYAQWNDDVHHGLHTAITGEDAGYYADYRGDTEKLARALAEGFAFQGEMMDYRGAARGEPSRHLPPTAFIAFLQNHDQIGNRAFGDRITASNPAEAVRAAAAVYLLAPQIPMLFMGEEWAAAQPFPFFCDFEDTLAEAVRNGRRQEFARFPEFQDEKARERIPDPTAQATFLSAKLAWDDRFRAPHSQWLDWYRRVLQTRKIEIIPKLAQAQGNSSTFETLGDGAFRVAWRFCDGSTLTLLANLSSNSLCGSSPGRHIWIEGVVDRANGILGPWSLIWSIDDGEHGSPGAGT